VTEWRRLQCSTFSTPCTPLRRVEHKLPLQKQNAPDSCESWDAVEQPSPAQHKKVVESERREITRPYFHSSPSEPFTSTAQALGYL